MGQKGCGSLGVLFQAECMDYLRLMSVVNVFKPSVHNLHAL